MTVTTPQLRPLWRQLTWWTLAFPVVMIVAIARHDMFLLNWIHVLSGALWTGADLFMGFILGPTLRMLEMRARRWRKADAASTAGLVPAGTEVIEGLLTVGENSELPNYRREPQPQPAHAVPNGWSHAIRWGGHRGKAKAWVGSMLIIPPMVIEIPAKVMATKTRATSILRNMIVSPTKSSPLVIGRRSGAAGSSRKEKIGGVVISPVSIRIGEFYEEAGKGRTRWWVA